MQPNWQPIHPESLQRHLMKSMTSAEQNQLTPVQVQAPKYTGVGVSAYQVTVQAMADLGFEDIAHLKTTKTTFFYILDVAAYADITVDISDEHPQESIVLMKRHGVGFRVGVVATDIETSLAVTLATVAASAQLKGATTSLAVKTYGFGIDAVDAIRDLASYRDGFTPQALTLVGNANEMLTQYVAEHRDNLVPVALNAATFRLPRYSAERGPANIAVSWHFALESMYRRQTLEMATKRALDSKDYASEVILPVMAAAYDALGVSSSLEEPSADVSNEAFRILSTGR